MKHDPRLAQYPLTREQALFASVWYNMTYAYSLDSHRVRVMHAVNILEELLRLTALQHASNEDRWMVAREAISILDTEEGGGVVIRCCYPPASVESAWVRHMPTHAAPAAMLTRVWFPTPGQPMPHGNGMDASHPARGGSDEQTHILADRPNQYGRNGRSLRSSEPTGGGRS